MSQDTSSRRPSPAVGVCLAACLAALLGACAGRDATPAAGREPPATAASLGPGVEALSLLGQPLRTPTLPDDVRAEYEAALQAALADVAARPDDVEALILVGRRLGQLGRFREAVEVFTDGLRRFPDEARLLRFRGHRWITLREFGRALADLTRAAELVEGRPDESEPSLTPNARGIDLDTLHENIWYHLALAHYLRGEWEDALEAWRRCAAIAPNDDGRAMCAYWMANAASRQGRDDAVRAAVAGITADMDVVEYHAYHQLALLWKGERDGETLLAAARTSEGAAGSVEFATLGYGVATWHRARGDEAASRRILDEVLASPVWYAFGTIAAEADRARER